MNFPSSETSAPTMAGAEPSGLSPEHRVALAKAAEMIAAGLPQDEAVGHLVENGMPRVVAKVLVKQYDRKRA